MITWNLTHNIHVEVKGTPVPWSAPFVGGGTTKKGRKFWGSRKDPNLVSWQADVHAACREQWVYEPHRGPIHLDICFRLLSQNGEPDDSLVIPKFKHNESQDRWTKQFAGLPDLTNLTKAVEDGIAGTIFLDDIQVRSQTCSCVWHHEPGVLLSVGFIDIEKPLMDLF